MHVQQVFATQGSAKDTYTTASKNLCCEWDRTIFAHKFIPHKIIHLEEKYLQKLMKNIKKVIKHI